MKTELEKIKLISTHKNNVIKYGMRLVKWLCSRGLTNEAKNLLSRLYSHDHSKFSYPEWDYIFDPEDKEMFEWTISIHRRKNDHHPEWWADGINGLLKNKIAAMELVVDCYTRSIENKRNIFEWIEKEAIPRFNIDVKSKEYKRLIKYAKILSIEPKR